MRKLIAALFLGCALLVSSCATQLQADGTVKNVVVGCEATTPAKSLACASATLKAWAAAADKKFLAGQIPIDKAERLQLRFVNIYNLLKNAEEAIALGSGNDGDYLQIADDLLAAVEKELS